MNACSPRSFGGLADREGGVRAAPVSMGVMTAICRTGAESTVFKPEQHGAVLQKFWLKCLRPDGRLCREPPGKELADLLAPVSQCAGPIRTGFLPDICRGERLSIFQ